MFASLRIRNYRVFFTGQLIANIGNWTQRIAQDWLVLTLTGSATAVGITTALQFLPTLLLGPVGGSLADRYPKRTVLLTTQTVIACCAAVLGTLVLTHTVRVEYIFAVATVLGLATAVDNPTRQSFAGELVGPGQLRNAISLNSAAFQLGATVGPAVSGVLIGWIGIGSAFVVNAASFGASVFALTRVRTADLHLTPRSAAGAMRAIDAARTMHTRPQMWWPMVLAATFSLFTMNFPVTLAAFSATVFHGGPSGFALLTCMLAGGSVVGSLLAARRGPLRLRQLVTLAGALASAQLLAALAPGEVAFAAALTVTGLASVMFGVSANATVQLAAGEQMRGRVMGIYLVAVFGAGCVGGPVVGAIIQHLGPRAGLLAGAVLPGLVTVAVALTLARTGGIDVAAAVRGRVRSIGSSTRGAVVGWRH
ncbi:MFS transporter [Nakamurella endophytica]|uniref:MFS transporter n=1 Tax=Nakamurella endophytica TaxID=1748367 RepID=A0A917T6I3_9ACTN|nr:MFS transporter [Nakamurella endophytica]GGM12241.1 MFS transporter [Nakamurella endophytica]